jgi:hypothetical protein
MPEDANPTPAQDASTDQEQTPTVNYAELYETEKAKNARLKADVDKHRTRADTVEQERLQKASLEEQVEAFKARAEEAERKATEAEAARVQAARVASLTGKVADPKAALKLLEDSHLTDDGDVNIDAFLNAYPFLAPAPATKPGVNAANPTRTSGDGPLTDQDFRGKDPEWIAENLHRLKPRK